MLFLGQNSGGDVISLLPILSSLWSSNFSQKLDMPMMNGYVCMDEWLKGWIFYIYDVLFSVFNVTRKLFCYEKSGCSSLDDCRD